jgi:hypothetical protein
MISFLQSCVRRCKTAGCFLFRACFAADSNNQLWQWMLPRETQQLRADGEN